MATLIVCSGTLTAFQYVKEHKDREYANHLFRQQWEAHKGNSHEAAHFGTYLFKPLNVLGAFDQGLNEFIGTTYRIEAHVQHEVDYNNAEQGSEQMRFGELTVALILQLLLPLLILFQASATITAERESGTLALLFSQGIKPAQLLWAKVAACYCVALSLVLPVFAFIIALLALSPGEGSFLLRFLLSASAYLLYYFLLVLIGVFVSAISPTSKTSTLIVLTFWLITGILIPKLTTQMAEKKYPLMSRAEFGDKVKQGYLKGLNGRDPYYTRGEKYIKMLLAKYHADTVSQLPVDANALVMQYNEDYQNKVFDYYHSQIEDTFFRQQTLLNYAGMIDPFIGLKRVSTSMSGTNFYHHNNFFLQAKKYRNDFIRTLNLSQACNPAKDVGPHYISPGFFSHIPDFHYKYPSLGSLLLLQKNTLFALCGWIIVLIITLRFTASRTSL